MGTGSVAVVVLDDNAIPLCATYELGIACAVFGVPHTDLADPWYEFRLCATGTSATGTSATHTGPGLVLNTHHGIADLHRADTVIVPSVPDECMNGSRELPPELLQALRHASAAGTRMVSLCNGVFALAAAGLLDGRRATTHWQFTKTLAQRHPAVRVDDSVLYVDEGDLLTSAGLSAGLDLCLHLVRRDLGAHIANQLARRMVVPMHRPGGQAQFIDLAVPVTDQDGLAPVLHWAQQNLHRPLTIADLATRANMSTRTFHRRLLATTGTTPMKWLLSQRLTHAQALLESTDLPITTISQHSGLGTANNLRRLFTTHLGLSPTNYRRAFNTHPPSAYQQSKIVDGTLMPTRDHRLV